MATAGKVDFPTHMKTVHQDWLYQTGNDTITSSITDAMNAALATNPYNAVVADNPATRLAAMATQLSTFSDKLDELVPIVDMSSYVQEVTETLDTYVISDTVINNDVDAFGDVLDDQIETSVLPKFQAGLRDINAVQSSAFMIGEAIIWGMRDRDVAKYQTDLRLKSQIQRNDLVGKITDRLLQLDIGVADLYRTLLHYKVEIERLGIVAEKEEADAQIGLDVAEAKWDLELFQYGGSLLGAMGGGTYLPPKSSADGPSTTQSAIGGALAGAAIGSATIGGWEGAAIGGVLGLGASFL